TAAVRIPAHAVLDFAIGIPRPAWPQGAVVFEVRACEGEDVCDLLFEEALDPSTGAGRGWQDRRVSLDSVAGSDRTFVFMTRLTNPDPRAFSFPLWANPTVYAPIRRYRADANVVLLPIDTLGAHPLRVYGY